MSERQRYTVSVTDEMFQQIEDFRFENRFQTRSDATSELIRLGLQVVARWQATPANLPEQPEQTQ